MPELDCGDTEMRHYSISPDGPVDGDPVWSVVSGQGTLHSDPQHADWEPGIPDSWQRFLVSNTLPDGVIGPEDTTFSVNADVDMGAGVQPLSETIVLHVHNRATVLNGSAKPGVPKPGL